MEAISPGFIEGFGLGFWTWAVLVLWIIFLIPTVAYERTGLAVLSVFLVLAILQFVGGLGRDVFGYVLDNPVVVLKWAALYVTIGVCYSFLRWDLLSRKWRKRYDAVPPGTYAQEIVWAEQPDASQSKNRITSWTMFWPWSMFWWLLSDFIVSAFEWVYDKLTGVYTYIAQRHIAGAVPPPEKERK